MDKEVTLETPILGRALRNENVIRIVLALVGIGFASLAHYITPPSLLLWHIIFQRLYYLPIVYAAIYFGWRGGMAAAALSSICYIPHIVMVWSHEPRYMVDQFAEIVVFFLVGIVTGLLADREQKRKRELEQTTQQLSKVYRELQDSFEQLKRADRLSAIGQLAASLAHEIRNPLASIEGAVNVLDQPETSDDMRVEFRGIIRKECRRLNQLLTNLLDFARPRQPEYQQVAIYQKLDSIVALVAHEAGRHGITFRKDVPASTPTIECDPEQLRQVVLNLALNAIQAMPQGGEIAFSARPEGPDMLIQVKDQGCGIREEDLDKIFDPFFTTKESGTGLGLSVAHRIVTQHGGTITVERNTDKGMTFSVLLPLRAKGNL
ncbi:MAG: sensor histidine kinase [Acidobacteria bacterium]|nr:sensor histidine kinase [Acidobacteriota bacterium]